MQRKDLFVVELETGVWLKGGEQGIDTIVYKNAEQFLKFKDAKACMNNARRNHKYFNARVVRVENAG